MKIFRAHLFVIIAEFFWGLSAPIAKVVMSEGMNGLQLVTFRIIGSALLFWTASIFVKEDKVPLKDLLKMGGAGFLAVMLNQTSFTVGLNLTSPVNATIMTTTMPLLTMFFAFIFLREPITWKKALGILLGATGVILIVLNSGNNSGKASNVLGDILVIVAQLSFALYLTLYKNFLPRYSGFTIIKWMFTFGLLATPFTGLSFTDFYWEGHSEGFWWGVTYVVVGATFLSYIFIMAGQKVLRPTVVSIYNYIQPIVACLVSVALGLGVFGLVHTAAVILVISGVILVMKSKSRAQQLEEMKQK